MSEAVEIELKEWQKLMDGAYEKWQGQKWTYSQFLANLDAKERQAVLLGNMNYQIGNGGVQQWVDNGYALKAVDLFDVLKLMGSPRAMEWLAKLEPFVDQYVDLSAKDRGFGQDYWLDKGDDEGDEYQREDERPHWGPAEALTDFYYEEPFNAELLREIDEFLSK